MRRKIPDFSFSDANNLEPEQGNKVEQGQIPAQPQPTTNAQPQPQQQPRFYATMSEQKKSFSKQNRNFYRLSRKISFNKSELFTHQL